MAGRQGEVLGWVDLARLDHPYDEQLWCASARLLYGLDRQADAIDRLATLRRTLLDDLGLDPAPTTVELERAILNQDVRLRRDLHGPSATSAPALTRTQLPPLGTLIGRDELVEGLAKALSDHQSPFVITLVGPAGVGKTSVATHVVSRQLSCFADGATFVDLTTLPPAEAVWPAVAAAVGLKPSSPQRGRQELVELLRSRDQLVILDGCEHVIDGVSDLLRDVGPQMTILATSRSPLGVPLEQVRVVEPLAPTDMTELFLRRARAADARFEPSDQDLRDIRRIIDALDGLALGAELTAPLIRSMTPRDLADSLDRSGSLPTLHRPMRDAILFSISLLDEAARKLLVRMSVFAGGTDVAGIRFVCGDEPSPEGPSLDANVHALVDASLLVAERTPHGMWYRMLHPIRMVAQERLDDGERDDLRQRHARFLIGEVRRLSTVVESNNPRPAVDALDRQAANIRQAWLTLTAEADGDARVELLAAFSPLALAACQRLPDASAWLGELVSAPEVRHGRFGLEITLNAAMMLGLEHEEYVDLTTQACDQARQRGDVRSSILANALLTEALSDRDNEVAATRGLLTLDLARQLDDDVMFGLAVAFAVNPMLRTRDFSTVRRVLNEALTSDTSSYGLLEPLVLYQAGRLEMSEGNLTQAQQHFRRAEQAANRTAIGYGLPYALYGMAQVARREGRVHDALSLMRQVAEMDRVIAPTQVAPHCLWTASLAFELEDEHAVASCLTALGRPADPLDFAAEQTIRGLLALLRHMVGAAQEHLDEALHVCATSVNADFFIEIAASWRRTVSADKSPSIDDVLADVANGTCRLDVALRRLRGIAGTKPA
jgi:predicted ATPase